MRALLAYLDALQAWDFEGVMACFDEALEHRILPQSLGRPVLNKRQYGEYFGAIIPLMKKSEVMRSTFSHHPFANELWHSFFLLPTTTAIVPQITIHEIIEAGDKMTVHVRTYRGSYTNSNFSIPRIHTPIA